MHKMAALLKVCQRTKVQKEETILEADSKSRSGCWSSLPSPYAHTEVITKSKETHLAALFIGVH